MRETITTVLITLLFWGCSSTNQIPSKYSKSENKKEFNFFILDIEKDYIYLEDKKDILECIKENYSKKVEFISNTHEHILFYENLLNEFYDNHIHLDINTSESYRIDSPIYVINKKNKTYINSVWQTQLKDTLSVNVIGLEIVEINNKDFQKEIEQFPTTCQDKNDTKVREWLANKILAGKRNENRVLSLNYLMVGFTI